MAAAKIRCNDEVIVLSGKDKGKRGQVQRVFKNLGKAIVTGINIIKKHQKPVPDKNQPGGVLEKEAPVDLSNLAIFNVAENKSDHVKFQVKDGKKIRIFKSNGSIVK